jgi:hypothetical protein
VKNFIVAGLIGVSAAGAGWYIANFKANIETSRLLEELRKEHEDDYNEMVGSLEEQLETARSESQKMLEDHAKHLVADRNEKVEVAAKRAKRINELEAELKSMKDGRDVVVNQLRLDHDKIVETLNANHDKRLKAMKSDMERMKSMHETQIKAELKELTEQYESRLLGMRDDIDSVKNEWYRNGYNASKEENEQKLKAEYDEKLKKMSAKYDERMEASLKASYDEGFAAGTNSTEKDRRDLMQSHSAELNRVRAEAFQMGYQEGSSQTEKEKSL